MCCVGEINSKKFHGKREVWRCMVRAMCLSPRKGAEGDLLGTVVLVEGLKLAGRNGLVQQEECSKFLVSKQGFWWRTSLLYTAFLHYGWICILSNSLDHKPVVAVLCDWSKWEDGCSGRTMHMLLLKARSLWTGRNRENFNLTTATKFSVM